MIWLQSCLQPPYWSDFAFFEGAKGAQGPKSSLAHICKPTQGRASLRGKGNHFSLLLLIFWFFIVLLTLTRPNKIGAHLFPFQIKPPQRSARNAWTVLPWPESFSYDFLPAQLFSPRAVRPGLSATCGRRFGQMRRRRRRRFVLRNGAVEVVRGARHTAAFHLASNKKEDQKSTTSPCSGIHIEGMDAVKYQYARSCEAEEPENSLLSLCHLQKPHLNIPFLSCLLWFERWESSPGGVTSIFPRSICPTGMATKRLSLNQNRNIGTVGWAKCVQPTRVVLPVSKTGLLKWWLKND